MSRCAWGCGKEIRNPANLRRHEDMHGRRLAATALQVGVTAQEAADGIRRVADAWAQMRWRP